jgi:hypothetical protein
VDERVSINTTGQVKLKLKTLWRDGSLHVVTSFLEFAQRLAALLPQPRMHPPSTTSRRSISVVA